LPAGLLHPASVRDSANASANDINLQNSFRLIF
jgi:hypothetical protein